METILNHVADLFFWGSVAAVAWGAAPMPPGASCWAT